MSYNVGGVRGTAILPACLRKTRLAQLRERYGSWVEGILSPADFLLASVSRAQLIEACTATYDGKSKWLSNGVKHAMMSVIEALPEEGISVRSAYVTVQHLLECSRLDAAREFIEHDRLLMHATPGGELCLSNAEGVVALQYALLQQCILLAPNIFTVTASETTISESWKAALSNSMDFPQFMREQVPRISVAVWGVVSMLAPAAYQAADVLHDARVYAASPMKLPGTLYDFLATGDLSMDLTLRTDGVLSYLRHLQAMGLKEIRQTTVSLLFRRASEQA